jgi:hypothetical protein
MSEPNYPRYFTHTDGFTSDALYVRFDRPDQICVVVTAKGERSPNLPENAIAVTALFGAYFSLRFVLGMVQLGVAVEITREQAEAMASNSDESVRNPRR